MARTLVSSIKAYKMLPKMAKFRQIWSHWKWVLIFKKGCCDIRSVGLMVCLFIRQNATFFLVSLFLHLSLCLCFVLPLSVHLSRYLYFFPSVNLSVYSIAILWVRFPTCALSLPMLKLVYVIGIITEVYNIPISQSTCLFHSFLVE